MTGFTGPLKVFADTDDRQNDTPTGEVQAGTFTGNVDGGIASGASKAELNLLDGAVATVSIALAASATTDGMDITVTAKDAAGATLAGVHEFVMHMSEAATGIGLTADAYSGDLTASVGAILGALTAKKAWVIQTAATGIFTATLVDSANPTDQYVVVKKPVSAGVVVSAASGTNWEGV